MNERTLRSALLKIPLGGIRYFEQTGSTSDVALAWASADAPDLALVYAEEQTAGRGRGGHHWFTPPGTALAFSLVLRPQLVEKQSIPFFTALGALSVCKALEALSFKPQIKWPNDVLLNRRKVSGILAESVWMGERIDSIVLGIGVNIGLAAVPPADQLDFPATCLDAENCFRGSTGESHSVDRVALLREILQALLYWRGLMTTITFCHAWEDRLAFRGERVEIRGPGQETKIGQVEGLEEDGSLRLCSLQGDILSIQYGEVRLRPVV